MRKYITLEAVLLLVAVFVFACSRQIPVYAQPSWQKVYRFHEATFGEVLLNNLEMTPGVVRTTNANEVCNGGSTTQFRHTTEKMKREVYAEYGVTKSAMLAGTKGDNKPPLYEIDHLISLELGGADEVMNLWPQPYYQHPGAHEKDAVENYLHREVCAGHISLTDAQRQIADDWYSVYLRMPKN